MSTIVVSSSHLFRTHHFMYTGTWLAVMLYTYRRYVAPRSKLMIWIWCGIRRMLGSRAAREKNHSFAYLFAMTVRSSTSSQLARVSRRRSDRISLARRAPARSRRHSLRCYRCICVRLTVALSSTSLQLGCRGRAALRESNRQKKQRRIGRGDAGASSGRTDNKQRDNGVR